MLWVLVSLMGCYAPPEINAETSYISDVCGALSKQITVHSDPDTLVTLHREDEMIAEYRTGVDGTLQVGWPSTSLEGVQARVGRPNTYSAVDLADPLPTLEPVWREGRVDHMRCVGSQMPCMVSAAEDGVGVDEPMDSGAVVTIEGAPRVDRTDFGGDFLRLQESDLADWDLDPSNRSGRCDYVTVPGVAIAFADEAVRGDVWLSKRDAPRVVFDVLTRTRQGPDADHLNGAGVIQLNADGTALMGDVRRLQDIRAIALVEEARHFGSRWSMCRGASDADSGCGYSEPRNQFVHIRWFDRAVGEVQTKQFYVSRELDSLPSSHPLWVQAHAEAQAWIDAKTASLASGE